MKVKILLVCLLIVAFAAGARAQLAKHVSEDAKSSEKTIQNAPFSADSVTESVQILWDGTKIVRKMSSKLYRDNEGRFRREDSRMQLGVPGQNVEIAESIRIVDPVGGVKYMLDVKDRRYKKSETKKKFELNLDSKFKLIKENEWNVKKEVIAERQAQQKARQNEKEAERQAKEKEKQAENKVKQVESSIHQTENVTRVDEGVQRIENTVEGDGKRVPVYNPGDNKPPEKLSPNDDKKGPMSKNEALGTQTIEGVTVEGTRTTTTIPVGTIGNDRDINIVYEKWYSKELQMTVFSKHSDPRFGEQTYRLSNISRKNPAISLFTPPADYRDQDEDDGDGDGDGDGDDDGDGDGGNDRTKKPRVPAKPSGSKIGNKPSGPVIGKPPVPTKPVI